MFEDIQKAKKIIEYFQQHGILCSIDDFGTGYSSLAILKDLSMDILKLDKQFFRHNCDVTRAKFIVKEVITLAHNLGMKVVAEGVESEEQIAFLRDLGCEWIQSFFYAQPMPLEDFASRYVITASSAEA
jgi:EAL domain-containing protein (putative c-di-GMP-specific phosphodiesterase class I)